VNAGRQAVGATVAGDRVDDDQWGSDGWHVADSAPRVKRGAVLASLPTSPP
jgi:hypothetical protein